MTSSSQRMTAALVERLRSLGVNVSWSPGEPSGIGTLPLGDRPFHTLEGEVRIPEARFYTLGPARLKFFEPRAFFVMPAVDVAHCHSLPGLQNAFREAWGRGLRHLAEARSWLGDLGNEPEVSGHGTRLTLPLAGIEGPPARVVSTTEILLPSAGVLADVSLRNAAARVHRPARDLALSSELELDLTSAMSQAAEDPLPELPRWWAPVGAPPGPGDPDFDVADEKWQRRVLLVEGGAEPSRLESALRDAGYEVERQRDPMRALSAFDEHSYDLVLCTAHLPRTDGLEFTMRVHEQQGIARLPVVVIDERDSPALREAALVNGAAAYISPPIAPDELRCLIEDLLSHDRRFVRYPARLPVEVHARDGGASEVAVDLGRGGFALRTDRDVRVGDVERYRITMPSPLEPVEVDGRIACRIAAPGEASVLAGVRFARFSSETEEQWIRLIRALDRRLSGG